VQIAPWRWNARSKVAKRRRPQESRSVWLLDSSRTKAPGVLANDRHLQRRMATERRQSVIEPAFTQTVAPFAPPNPVASQRAACPALPIWMGRGMQQGRGASRRTRTPRPTHPAVDSRGVETALLERVGMRHRRVTVRDEIFAGYLMSTGGPNFAAGPRCR